ncbi:MAG: glycosyltransferase [Gammaproteobacteria bacterium]|nr:glycosyltransferase [Gammaproteobacteria bacterium]
MHQGPPETGISVLLPVHNGGQYLNESVRSILAQTGVELELLIIDDHSKDGAIAALPNDARLQVLTSPQRGIVAALNYGLQQARYSIIARMDADDIAAPDRLSTQLAYLAENPSVEFCGAVVEIFRDNGAVEGGFTIYQDWINNLQQHHDITRELFIECPIPHPTFMLRKSALLDLGGYLDKGWPEDYDLCCRALLAGFRFGKPSGPALLRWRDHAQRLSRNDQSYAKQAFLRCKAHYLKRFFEARQQSHVWLWGAGKTGLKLHDYLTDEGLHVAGFYDVNPRMIGVKKRNKTVLIVDPEKQKIVAPDAPVLIAVSARGARQDIRKYLANCDWREGRDFVCVA